MRSPVVEQSSAPDVRTLMENRRTAMESESFN